MPSSLARVVWATKEKRRAEHEYRAALLAAVAELEESGVAQPYAKVAKAAGVSRQAVREMVARSRT